MVSTGDEIILAAFGQLDRNAEFQIMTKIVSRNGNTLVRKSAYTAQSIAHVQKLKLTFERFTKSFPAMDKVRPVKILASGVDFVEFEHIKGQNLEQTMFNSIRTGDYENAMRIIDRVFSLIDQLSSKRKSGEYDIASKINDVYNLPRSSAKFTYPGVIDLNLDNFILSSDDELIAFDYEWVFDQPIVTDYIKTRLLYTFFAKRSEAFAYLPSETNVFNAVIGGNVQTLIPAKVYKKYGKYLTKESLAKYWQAEDIFQKYVNASYSNMYETNYKNFAIKEVTSPKTAFPDIADSLRVSLEQTKHNYDLLVQHSTNLEGELQRIKSSNTYRVALKMRAAKNKITRRKS